MNRNIKRMPFGDGKGARAAAEACLEVLPPNDALSDWLHFYLEHTAELQAREAEARWLLEHSESAIGLGYTGGNREWVARRDAWLEPAGDA